MSYSFNINKLIRKSIVYTGSALLASSLSSQGWVPSFGTVCRSPTNFRHLSKHNLPWELNHLPSELTVRNYTMKIYIAATIALTWGVACATSSENRNPASPVFITDYYVMINTATLQTLQDQLATLSLQDCSATLAQKYDYALKLKPHHFAPEIFSDIPTARAFTDAAFALRLRLRSKLRQWHAESAASPAAAAIFKDCLSRTRDAIRATRYMDEYVSQVILSRNAWKVNDQVLSFHEPINPEMHGFFLKVNPDYTSKTGAFADNDLSRCSSNVDSTHRAWLNEKTSNLGEFCSGDVISSRGRAHTSAAIARVADTAGQYSHISFVYLDPKREVKTIESHIENGVKLEPMFVHLYNPKTDQARNFRETLYRATSEATFAHLSAKAIYEHIAGLHAAGKSVEYDFTMNQSESDTMFCSEVVSWGFRNVPISSRTLEWKERKVPLFLSHVSTQSNPVTKAMNLKSPEVFAPSDMDTDYRFEIVSEWRDLKTIRDSMEKDAILTKVFQWLKKENWVFDYGVKASLAYFMSASGLNHTSIPKWISGVEVSPTINGDTAAAFVVINQVGSEIQKKLAPFAAEIEKQNGGYPATFDQLLTAIEKIGRMDLSGDQDFTNLIHPREKGLFEK